MATENDNVPPLELENVGKGPALNIALSVDITHQFSEHREDGQARFWNSDGGSVGAGASCIPTMHTGKHRFGVDDAFDVLTVEYSGADGRHFRTVATWTRVGWREVRQEAIAERSPRMTSSGTGIDF